MDPILLQMLQSISSGAGFGSPNAGAGSDTAMNGIFDNINNFMNKDKESRSLTELNTNTLRDIDPYKVNPYRGFLAQHGGEADIEGVQGNIPLEFMSPSTSLLGGNLMNSVRGQIGMAALQTMMKGGFANSELKPETFKEGGFLSRLGQGVKGAGDMILSGFGLGNILQNTGHDDFVANDKFGAGISGITSGISKFMTNKLLPGAGSAVGMLNNAIPQNAGQPQQGGQGLQGGSNQYQSMGSLFNMINQPQQQPTSGMFQGQLSGGQGPYGGMDSIMSSLLSQLMASQGGGQGLGSVQDQLSGGQGTVLGQTPFGQGFGTDFQGLNIPGFSGGMMKVPIFAEGGPVSMNAMTPLVPVQAEKVNGQSEMIIHNDFTITPVNATTTHKKMDDDEVTDFVVDGSYITSADPSMTVTYEEAEDIVIGVKHMPYKERKQGKVPKEVTLASLWTGNKKGKRTFAELTERLSKKIKVIDKSEDLKFGNDIFTQLTNKANLESRVPYIAEIVALNEEKRPGSSNVVRAQHGGPVKMPGVKKVPFGDFIKDNPQLLASALPFISSLFGGGNGSQNGAAGVSPQVQAGILGSIPLGQLGINQNINAQQDALGNAVNDFSALGNQLIDNARQSTQFQSQANFANVGLGLANQLGQETDLPELNLGASRSRINNFQPRSASRAAVEAAGTPNFDAQAIMDTMGARSGPVLAQLASNQQRGINEAAMNRNQQLDQFDLNKVQMLNQLDATEQPFNINQQEKEMALRNNQRSGIFGTLGQGVQRGADLQSGLLGQIGGIQSQILPITTQLAMQNAQLSGQKNILGAQNLLNASTTLGGMQSQNNTASQLPQNQGGADPNFGKGKFDSLANFFRSLGRGDTPPGVEQLPTSLDGMSEQDIATLIARQLTGRGMGVTNPLPTVNQIPRDPLCRDGVNMMTGQPC